MTDADRPPTRFGLRVSPHLLVVLATLCAACFPRPGRPPIAGDPAWGIATVVVGVRLTAWVGRRWVLGAGSPPMRPNRIR